LVRASLWVPCWTNLRLIKVILVASTLTYLPSLEVASSKNSVVCIKRSAPSQVHIIWNQSFGSWYKFYPIQIFFFVFCPGLCFCPCSIICVLVYILFRSCLRLVFCYLRSCSCSCHVLVLVVCVFHTLCQKKKKEKKSWRNFEKKSGCLFFEYEIEAFRGIFWKENRGSNPLF